jgi:hypothetical protein
MTPVQKMITQKQLGSVKNLRYLGSMTTNDAREAREIIYTQ